MKILFISSIDPKRKSGLFIAVHNRIKQYKYNNDFSVNILNISYFDSYSISKVRSLLNLNKTFSIKDLQFKYDEIVYNNLSVKINILNKILLKIGRNNLIIKKILNENYVRIYEQIKNVDLVFIHGGFLVGEIGCEICKFFKKPFFIMFHGSDIHEVPKKSRIWFENTKKMISSSQETFFVSHALRDLAKRLKLLNKNGIVSYSGVNRDIYFKQELCQINTTKKKLGINENVKIVGFVGNIISVKNVEMLPEIFYMIKKIFKREVAFVIAGDGYLKDKINSKMQEMGLEVSFLGRIEPSKMPDIMNVLDVLCVPSKNEGLGLVVLEALSCGVKCVCSRVGGMPEILGESDTVNLDKNFVSNFSQNVVAKLNDNSTSNKQNNFSWEKTYQLEKSIILKFGP